MKKSILIIILILFFCKNSFSQKPIFKNYSPDNGLASYTVYYALQDSKGYIWFATESGISRFDGYKFTNFTIEDGLGGDEIFYIHEDSKKRIWFLSYNGKLSYYYNGSIYNHSNDTLLHKTKTNIFFKSFLEDKDSNLWFGTGYNGIIKLTNNKKVEKYNVTNGLPDNNVFFIWEDNKNEIWAALGNGIVNITKNYKKISISYPFIDMPSDLKLLKKNNGRVIFFHNKKLFEICDSLIIPIDTFNIITKKINSLSQSKNNNIWVATNTGAILFENGKISDDNGKRFLKGEIISSVLQDKENNIWFTTLGNGVFYTPSVDFLTYKDELQTNEIFCIDADNNNNIWLGSKNGNYSIIKKGKIKNYKTIPFFKTRNRVKDILCTSDNTIWIGTDNILINFDNGNIENFLLSSIKSISENKKGDIWIARSGAVFKLTKEIKDIARYSKGDNWQKKISNVNNFMKYKSIYNITTHSICADDTILWLGTLIGLKAYIYDKDTIIDYSTFHNALKQRITSIKISEDATLYVATYGKGLVIIKNDSIYNITTKNGLISNICKSLYVVDNNNIWLATNSGINKIEWSAQSNFSYKIKTYNINSGLASNEVNEIYAKGDNIWVATSNGLTVFNESKIYNNNIPPPIYITNVSISDLDTIILNKYTLPYYNNNIKIDFLGLSYKNRIDLSYLYKMEGLDTTWHNTENKSVVFRALSPGNYKFLVKAKIFNTVSKTPAYIHFVIKKAFWQNWWFRALIIAFILGIISFIMNYRIQQIKKENKLKQKLTETKLSALSAQMHPHFISNSLNSIQNYFLNNDIETANKYLTDFGKLIRYILENSGQTNIPIANEIKSVKLYLSLEVLRLENKFEYKINIDENIDIYNSYLPSLIIQPYVENAIWHGIAPLDTKGKIIINFTKKNNGIICIIEDNGIGRKKSEELKRLYKKHKSISMNINKERLDLLNTKKLEQLSVNIIDLEDINGYNKGTRVELFIPFYKK